MKSILSAAIVLTASFAWAADVVPPIDQRFAAGDVSETPDFRQHVVPLLGRLGCNGRACHGSFQGRGGFKLSLFGYDFKADHENLALGEKPRISRETPDDSLALQKPLMIAEHEGGKRFEADSWQHRVLRNWIRKGANGVTNETPEFVSMRVTPAEIVAAKPGAEFDLRAVAVWSNGVEEDVTPLCRFQTNNDEIATIDANGRVSVQSKGDTHVVVFYDNAVVPVEVILPVSEQVGPAYPSVSKPTKVDELVVDRLQKLGIVPSDLCTDAEFLRRVSLDLTGTLPTPKEVEAFLADTSASKRSAKIDELLNRPGYAAWWATKLCDFTGNSGKQLNNLGNPTGPQGASREWFDWIRARVERNEPYDELVAGIVLATSRQDDESYAKYCERMSGYYQPDSQQSFASQESLTHYWARRNFRKPEDRALGFAYSFLGVRIQCAQCHKHPFDQWTKDDFDRFTTFFGRVNYGNAPGTKDDSEKMLVALGIDPKEKKNNNQRAKEMTAFLKDGKTIPFQELFVVEVKKNEPAKNNKNKKNDKAKKKQPQLVKGRTAKYLGGEEVKLDSVDDPRLLLMDWLRDDDNPYFAKAFVNRVWAGYFHRGIVEPADDLSLANPPSNEPLLEYLADEFRRQNYDMKWLHRTIVNSQTYQLSWRTNDTNRADHRNFSHAEPRRVPAEVAADAIAQATAADQLNEKWPHELKGRSISDAGGEGKRNYNYVLSIFGRSVRESNCDCDRSMDASLLQTVYLQNDQELLTAIERPGSWVDQVAKGASPQINAQATADNPQLNQKRKDAQQQLQKVRQRLKKARKQDPPNKEQIAKLEEQLKNTEKRVAKFGKVEVETPEAAPPATPVSTSELPALVRQAYLRTLSRLPSDDEQQRAERHLAETNDLRAGTRDLLWALLNTKEFLLNH